MFYLETPPRLIETKMFSSMPKAFRRKGVRTEWPDTNRPGQGTDCFVEGPSFDTDGNLYLVDVLDVPFGRIFKITPGGQWSLVAEYESWPNGLKICPDGIMELDAQAARMQPVLTSRNSESFHSCSELHIAGNGDIHFTDQGQIGLHDPTGCVYRLTRDGRFDRLIDTGISPNGQVLDSSEAVLLVVITRDNAAWHLPFMKEGSVSKVRRFCSMFGPSGHGGMTMDRSGCLLVAHAPLGHVFVFVPNGEWVARIKSCAGATCTNAAIGGNNRDRLYITASATGTVLVADISELS